MNILANNYLLIVKIGAAVLIGLFVILLALLVSSYYGSYRSRLSMEAQIKDQLLPEAESSPRSDTSIRSRWNKYWEKALIDSGVNFMAAKRENAGKVIFWSDLAVFAALTLLFKGQIIGSLIISVGILVIAGVCLSFMADKRIEKLTNQIPEFLSALLAANETQNSPRVVLSTAIKTTPKDLHAELENIEDQLDSGAALKPVLEDYIHDGSIPILRFLMICIYLAADAGKDMKHQLQKIQEVVENRQRVERTRKQAVASVMPTIWVSTIFIPAIFLYTYLLQPIARQFWFHTFFSWIVFLIVILLYGFGIWMSKHLVDKIKKL